MGSRKDIAGPSAILSITYYAIILWSVVNLGAARPFALSAACFAMATVTLIALVVYGVPERVRSITAVAAVLLVAALCWAGFQITNGAATALSETLQLVPRNTVSVQPADTLFSIQYFAYPALTFIAGLLILRSEARAKKFVLALIIGSVSVILFSLAQFLIQPDFVLFHEKPAYNDSFTATFFNRNNAGTFIGLVSLLLLRQFWASCRNLSAVDLLSAFFLWQNRPRQPLLPAVVYACLLMLVITALFLTKSRGAIGSTLTALALLGTILLWLRLKRKYAGTTVYRRLAVGLLALVFFASPILVLIGERVTLRAETIGTDDPRFCALPGILRAVSDQFWYGSGAGTFASVFAHYRDPGCGVSGVWEKAHNTYLQVWIEYGVVGPLLGLVIVMSLAAFFICLLASTARQNSYNALGLAAVTLVTVHASVDFSLEIPGIAAFFATVVAIAVAIGGSRRTRYGQINEERQRHLPSLQRR